MCRLLPSLVLAGCQLLQPQEVKTAVDQRTFAELSRAEQHVYLRKILSAQVQRIRAKRIQRVKSLEDRLTHALDLSAGMVDSGFGKHKLLRVNWSTVVADSIELLRCKQNITTNTTVTADNEVVAQGYDFEKLQSNPNGYGFIACDRVYGNIRDGKYLIDYSAENNFVYVYFLRPCFNNYLQVSAAADGEASEQCGAENISTTEQPSLQTKKLKLVFRYCQKDQQQLCSSVVSSSNPIALNQGIKKLPLELFDQRHELLEKIKENDEALYKLSNQAMEAIAITSGAPDQEMLEMMNIDERMKELVGEHEAKNEERLKRTAERNENIAMAQGIFSQNVARALENSEMKMLSFDGENCYHHGLKAMDTGIEDEAKAQADELNKVLNNLGNQIELLEHAGESEETLEGMQETHDMLEKMQDPEHLKAETRSELGNWSYAVDGLTTAGCLYKNYTAFKSLDKIATKHNFSKLERGLGIANIAVDMIPLRNSELNRSSSYAALGAAASGILMREDEYLREHCKECLDYIAKAKYHFNIRYLLEKQLETLTILIKYELKDVKDPYEADKETEGADAGKG